MSYKFDMSEYDKPLKEASSIDSDMSVSAAKENALKNLEIAEKFIKKVSTKTTDAQKKFIEERIADARREIQEAAKGIDPRDKEPYLLPTAKDLGKDNMQSYDNTNNRTEKPNSFKTIHFIRNESPAFGSGEDSYKFDTNIPIDAIRRIQEVEERIKRDVETIVKGNDRTQEVTRTVYVENEADPRLRAEIMDLQVRNTDLRRDIAALQAAYDVDHAAINNPGGYREQIQDNLATIAANDAEILRLAKLLYGDASIITPAIIPPRAPRIPGAPYTPLVRLNGIINPPGGMIPLDPAQYTTSTGYVGSLIALETKRDAEVKALKLQIDDTTPDGNNTISVLKRDPYPDVTIRGHLDPVPEMKGDLELIVGGLPKGLKPKAIELQKRIDSLVAMIEAPEIISDQAEAIKANNAARAAYDVEVAAYDRDKARFDAETKINLEHDAYDEYLNYEAWRVYENEKYLYDEEKKLYDAVMVEINTVDKNDGSPGDKSLRREAKRKLRVNNITNPWIEYVSFITRNKGMADPAIVINDINANTSVGDRIVSQMRTHLTTYAPVVPTTPVNPRPTGSTFLGVAITPAGIMNTIPHANVPPRPVSPRNVAVAPIAVPDPRTTALSTAVFDKLTIGTKPGEINVTIATTGNEFISKWPDATRAVPTPSGGGFRTQLEKMIITKDALNLTNTFLTDNNAILYKIVENLDILIYGNTSGTAIPGIPSGSISGIPTNLDVLLSTDIPAGFTGFKAQLTKAETDLAATQVQLAAANTTLDAIRASVVAVRAAIITIPPAADAQGDVNAVITTLQTLDETEKKTKAELDNLRTLDPSLAGGAFDNNVTNVKDLIPKIKKIIDDKNALLAANTALTQQLADATSKLKDTEARLQDTEQNLQKLLRALRRQKVDVNEDNYTLSFTEHDSETLKQSAVMRQHAQYAKRAASPGRAAAAAASPGRAAAAAASPGRAAAAAASSSTTTTTPDAKFHNDKNLIRRAVLNGKMLILQNLIDAGGAGITSEPPDWKSNIQQLNENITKAAMVDNIVEEVINKQLMVDLLESRFTNKKVLSAITDDEVLKVLKNKTQQIAGRRAVVHSAGGTSTPRSPEERQIIGNLMTLRKGFSSVDEFKQLDNHPRADRILDLLEESSLADTDFPTGFITAMVRYVDEVEKGGQGTKPDINDPSTYQTVPATTAASAAAATKPVTGGGYFDGGSYKTKRRMKISGGDDENDDIQDNVDVMLTAGVGGAVGSIMWLGWGGLVIFLLLLFIFYLGNNIYNDSCSNSSNLTNDKGLRKYRRELHKRK